MICIDELECLQKRLELLFNNTDNPEEKLATSMIAGNIENIVNQMKQIIESPDFKQMSKQQLEKE